MSIYSANDLNNPITASALGISSNVEFIRFTTPSAGNYVIGVHCCGSTSDTEFLALAYDY